MRLAATRAFGARPAAPVGAPSRTAPALGNQARLRRLPSPVQAKLEVGAADSPLEREADAAADAVVAPSPSAPVTVRRACAACEDEATVRREAVGVGAAGGEAPDAVGRVLETPGRPMDTATLAFMGRRFGADFSSVRVHDDPAAAASAAAIGAQAYTAGSHVVFGAGRYDAASVSGRRLIAHELAHTLQQAPGVRRACGPEAIGRPAGCRAADPVFGDGAIFRFNVNCDDWAPGAEAAVRAWAATLGADASVEIDGYASVEGSEPFNLALSCARAGKARDVLVAAGVQASRLTLSSHGPTPGPAADRRSVTLKAASTAAPTPPAVAPPTTQPPAQQPPAQQPPTQQPPSGAPAGGGGQVVATAPPVAVTRPTDIAPPPPPPPVPPAPTPEAAPPDEHPRLTLQIPVGLNAVLPIGGSGGAGARIPPGMHDPTLDQLLQPNIAIGLNYAFSPTDVGFNLGIFAQGACNFAPTQGTDRPTTTGGDRTNFGGCNLQGYLQLSYVFYSNGGNQFAVLGQAGVGRTGFSSVLGQNGLGTSVQGGFQYSRDIIANRIQAVVQLTGGSSWLRPDATAAVPDPSFGSAQGFIGVGVGVQGVIPLLDYPAPKR